MWLGSRAAGEHTRDEDGSERAGERVVEGSGTKKNCISPLIPWLVERLGRERIKVEAARNAAIYA